MSRPVDLAGKRFGSLVALSREGSQRRRSLWLCQCDCGATRLVNSNALIGGNTRSCGCLKRKTSMENAILARASRVIGPGVAAFRNLYRHYRTNAEKRGLVFELSEEAFRALTEQVCSYCGGAPSSVVRNGRSSFIYMGVDRADSSLGYTAQNSVPCCKMCNFMKRRYGVVEFLSHAEKIASFTKKARPSRS